MREILFRGKRIDNGEWIEGYLIHDEYCNTHIPYIGYLMLDDVDIAEVDPATVGQYTGLKDKNGKRIFEGDIVTLRRTRSHEVKWSDGGFSLEGTALPIKFVDRFELVGNVHDNPELIGGTE